MHLSCNDGYILVTVWWNVNINIVFSKVASIESFIMQNSFILDCSCPQWLLFWSCPSSKWRTNYVVPHQAHQRTATTSLSPSPTQWSCSSSSHRCSIGLRARKSVGQVNTSKSMSCWKRPQPSRSTVSCRLGTPQKSCSLGDNNDHILAIVRFTQSLRLSMFPPLNTSTLRTKCSLIHPTH